MSKDIQEKYRNKNKTKQNQDSYINCRQNNNSEGK